MERTQTDKLLLEGLQAFKVRKGVGAMIYTMMSTEELRWEMLNYMMGHPEATQDELLDEAYRIKGQLKT